MTRGRGCENDWRRRRQRRKGVLLGVIAMLFVAGGLLATAAGDVGAEGDIPGQQTPQDGIRVGVSEEQAQSEAAREGEDRVVTDTELDKLTQDLLKKKKDAERKETTLKVDEGMVYQVKLASGGVLQAVEIRNVGDRVTLIDPTGMAVNLDKKEIADIEMTRK